MRTTAVAAAAPSPLLILINAVRRKEDYRSNDQRCYDISKHSFSLSDLLQRISILAENQEAYDRCQHHRRSGTESKVPALYP